MIGWLWEDVVGDGMDHPVGEVDVPLALNPRFRVVQVPQDGDVALRGLGSSVVEEVPGGEVKDRRVWTQLERKCRSN